MKSTNVKESVAHYQAAYDRLAAGRSQEPAWLQATRRAAMAEFRRDGFPTTRDEEWRFTNVAPITENLFAIAGPTPGDGALGALNDLVEDALLPGLDGPRLVFVNGRLDAARSTPDAAVPGIRVTSLARALAEDPARLDAQLARHAAFAQRPFVALNTALFEDGALIEVSPNTVVEPPLQVLFLTVGTAPTMSNPRLLVLAGSNSQLRIVETFVGADGARGFSNAVTEVVAADGAVVEHYRLQRESRETFHIGHTQFTLERSSTCSSHAVALGGRIARHEVIAVLAGEGVDCTLNGLYLADGTRLVDNHTEIVHAKPHGTSHEIYKGILDGRAHAIFNGRIRVHPDAQKTDAKQTNKALLLSDEAQINTKPQLEIFANDVKCTHGATVGQLSEDALFYLRARGIGKHEARSMLIRAFAGDVTSRMTLQPVREDVERRLEERLAKRLSEKALV
jgi:Fe-S cluster assembly protein SufD